jgi:hypothetical protein
VTFGYKLWKIKNYDLELTVREEQVKALERELRKHEAGYERIREAFGIKEKTPSDCKPGEYCGACQFGKIMMVYAGFGEYEPYPFCTKGVCCDYWVERKTEND